MARDPILVDTPPRASVKFAPPDPPRRDSPVTSPRLLPVGPGRSAIVTPALAPRGQVEVNGYPVQPAKIQAPLVRDDTLRRDRLLDWLHARIHRRVVLVLADAGYGKTTLLADFSRRTRLQTLWYRLDETDGDWVSFIGHLVAAGRVHDPDFATTTYGLLGDLAAGTANRESIVNAFIRDLYVFSETGAALVLDDYHLIDAAADVRGVLRDILARGPERLTIVISSRRAPSLPLGRLRAQGEVAELGVDDLRFDATETERLFRESYGRTLEPDVLAELHRRTEGWAASLHLVQAAGRDRPTDEFRSLVSRLSGAEGHLYDYLAEEVLGELPPTSQLFLMRTSVLQLIDLTLASLVTQLSPADCRSQMEVAEQLGLLGRRPSGGRAAMGYHPLVKDVLLDRLRREEGEDAARQLHLRVARFAEERDWHLACLHYASASDRAAVGRVLDHALPTVMGSGAFLAASGFLDRADPPLESGPGEVIRSRVALANGDPEQALDRAARATRFEPVSPWAIANLASVHHSAGRVEEAAASAQLLRQAAVDPDLAKIGEATLALLGGERPVGPTIRQLLDFADHQQAKGRLHYAGIALLNAAALARLEGNAGAAVRDAAAAFQALSSSSDGSELAAARVALAWGLAHQGDLESSRRELEAAVGDARTWVKVESAIEAALTECWYGSRAKAAQYIAVAELHVAPSATDTLRALALARSQLALREGEPQTALDIASGTSVGSVSAWPELLVERLSLIAHASAVLQLPRAERRLEVARKAALRQGLDFWIRYLQVVGTLLPTASGDVFTALAVDDPAYLSIHAEILTQQLSSLDASVLGAVTREASARPERWREPLRGALETRRPDDALRAGEVLAGIGEAEDVLRLRRVGRALRLSRLSSELAYGLARRLAKRVYVEDQMRVVIRIGEQEVAGSQVRRKVLALLCFLLSRPSFSATRDQVLDALWPDLDPDVAINSLNQTVYFLRRVIEPAYREETSPGYIHHDSDVIWLDQELVASRSSETLVSIRRATEDPSPEAIDTLARTYRGRFALEFSYEEWATPFRESLHASYLQLIETAIAEDSGTGHYHRAIALARRALEVEPEAEQIEISLLRLYRLTGAHAAAAEQYAHYAAVQRNELGVEPPPLESL